MRPSIACLGLIALLGCRQDHDLRRSEVAELASRHQEELARFERARADFERRNPVPQQQEFQGDGTILVHECELRGWPGHEQFWLKYTWVNTSGRTVDGARVTITLRDQASGAEQSEEMELSLPLLYRLGPDSSYTTNILMPIRGMPSPPALDWEIRPRAMVETPGR